MKIVHINTNDVVGGAGKAAFRLHLAMRHFGIDSRMYVLNKYKKSDDFIDSVGESRIIRFRAILNILDERIKLRKYNPYATFSLASKGFNISTKEVLLTADVIYIHWINRGLLSIEDIEAILKLNKPVFWVLHDMWPFTGGCHYSFDCKQYVNSCGNCSLLQRNSSSDDISKTLLSIKRKCWTKYENLHIITPSNWMAECAKSSSLFGCLDITCIHNTIDLAEYSPKNKREARKQFGLQAKTKVILFGAHTGANNPYKGWKYMQEALEQIEGDDIEAVVLGSKLDSNIVDRLPMRVTCVGTLNDEASLAALYSAANVFVSPSLVDNFPNTIVEAMACNTPVVGFDIGGIPDLVNHKKNGYLAKYRDAADLSIGIRWAISQPQESVTAREFIFDLLRPEKIIGEHRKLWEKFL